MEEVFSNQWTARVTSYAGVDTYATHYYLSFTKRTISAESAGAPVANVSEKTFDVDRAISKSESQGLARRDKTSFLSPTTHRFNGDREVLAAARAVFEKFSENGDSLNVDFLGEVKLLVEGNQNSIRFSKFNSLPKEQFKEEIVYNISGEVKTFDDWYDSERPEWSFQRFDLISNFV